MNLNICNKYFYNNETCFSYCYYLNKTSNCDNLYKFVNKCFYGSCLRDIKFYDNIIVNKNCTDLVYCNDNTFNYFNIMYVIVISLICMSMLVCIFLIYIIIFIIKMKN